MIIASFFHIFDTLNSKNISIFKPTEVHLSNPALDGEQSQTAQALLNS